MRGSVNFRQTLVVEAVAGGFDADELHARLADVGMEDAHRVGAAADTGNHCIGLATAQLGHLGDSLLADD